MHFLIQGIVIYLFLFCFKEKQDKLVKECRCW